MNAAGKIGIVVAFLVMVFAVSAFGSATNIYITQNGSPTGNCTTNVQTPAFFNNAANWGSGSNQIGPGTTVLFCGTFTFSAGASGFTVQGSGTSGNPIVIGFDSGAVLQAPYFGGTAEGGGSGGAIVTNGSSYITIDGKGVGIIQNTLNGSSDMGCLGGKCSYQMPTVGVFVNGTTTGVTVKNLTIQNMYLNCGASTSCNDSSGQWSTDIEVEGNHTNLTIQGNTLKQARMGINLGGGGNGIRGWNIANNILSDHGWHMSLGNSGSGPMSGINIYGNTISNFLDWQFPISTYHQDGIIAYTVAPLAYTMYVYNNYWQGNMGCSSATSFISNGMNDVNPGPDVMYVFNNVFDATGSLSGLSCNQPGYNAVWVMPNAITYAYNNTFIGMEPTAGGTEVVIQSGSSNNSTYYSKNNIYMNTNGVIGSYTGTLSVAASSYNLYYNLYGVNLFSFNDGAGPSYTVSGWQAAGFDTNAVTTNPKLNSNYVPQSGSGAIGAGTNLYAVCNGQPNPGLGALCYDAAGSPRQSSGAWDLGAYADPPGSGTAPAAPSGLQAIVQ
jgi:hypothetical protein